MEKLTEKEVQKCLLQFSSESIMFLSDKQKPSYCLLFCMGVKLGLSQQWKNKYWRFLKKRY
jgi:hypothetical protein